jgi:hypothetical protein
MKTTIDMAREAGIDPTYTPGMIPMFKAFEALVRADERERVMNEPLTKAQWQRFEDEIRADEREACAKAVEEFARKWWKIHCDSNLHYSSTLKAHQDFCALQAAIRARSKP